MDQSSHNKNIPTDSPQDEVRLIPSDIKNELFTFNLEFFKKQHPDIYLKIESHQFSRYQICLNPDDSMNIYNIKNKSVIYPLNDNECEQYFNLLTDSLKLTFRPFTAYLEDNELSLALKCDLPLSARLHSDLLNAGTLLKKINPNTKQHSINKKQINFLPLLRVYGLGLGYHVTKAFDQYDIACLIINEPDFDLFYTSLFATPWHVILDAFNTDSNRHYLFNFNSVDSPITNEINLLNNLHPYYANAKAALFGMPDKDFSPLITAENNFDTNNCYNAAGGCYEDQAKGLANAIQNLNYIKPIYNGKKISTNAPIFLVGSGPSFDASIEYIKANQNNVLIIACGSAISALVKNGITPDLHILQERFVSKELLLNYADIETYKNITCIKLNVVDVEVDALYKNTYILQKANDPGSIFLSSKKYPLSYNVTPTVTNTGIALCRLLNPDITYLFGLDYGSSEDFSLKHSKYTTVLEADDHLDKEKQLIIEGYQGKKIYSNEYFIASRDVAEFEIARAKTIKWINVGSGAIINGTSQKETSQLPARINKKFDKVRYSNVLSSLFDTHYGSENFHQKMQDVHIPESSNYLLSLLDCFDTTPTSRSTMMTTINLITQASKVGSDEENYLPYTLFSLEFSSFFNNLYVQIAATSSDEEAINLYNKSVTIFKEHINLIFDHFLVIADTIKN